MYVHCVVRCATTIVQFSFFVEEEEEVLPPKSKASEKDNKLTHKGHIMCILTYICISVNIHTYVRSIKSRQEKHQSIFSEFCKQSRRKVDRCTNTSTYKYVCMYVCNFVYTIIYDSILNKHKLNNVRDKLLNIIYVHIYFDVRRMQLNS